MRLNLSVSDTNIFKGVALILLLTHHLFYIDNGLYSDIVVGDHGLVNNIGLIAKVCVAIFVLLSGYGLTASAEKRGIANLKNFYVHRYVKLYLNYWLIWLLFVPIGILIFDFTFEKAYGADYLYPLLADLTGTLNLCGKYGYNPTWWFYSCIIVLYLLFPLIYKMMQNRIGCISVIVVSIALFFAPFTLLAAVKYYLFPFVLGIIMRLGIECNILPPPILKLVKNSQFMKSICNGESGWIGIMLIFSAILVVCILRISYFNIMIDGILALLLVLLLKNLRLPDAVTAVLTLLGVHSFNIFLFHTFIYYYWFPDIIYWTGNPLISLLTLLAISLVISMFIERLKQWIRFDRISAGAENLLLRYERQKEEAD